MAILPVRFGLGGGVSCLSLKHRPLKNYTPRPFWHNVKKIFEVSRKASWKDAHEDLAKLQKSLQTAQDVAKIPRIGVLSRSVTCLEIGGRGQNSRSEIASGGITVCPRVTETISNLK